MTDPNHKILSIVIVAFNKWNFTKSCLKDLMSLPGDHEVIVIDNASTDETNVEINKFIDEHPGCAIAYKQNSENLFHSKACNQGFRMATGDNVLFLNNDIRVKSNHFGWTKTIIEACESTGGLVGPTMGLLDNNLNFVREDDKQLTGNSYLGGWCIAGSQEAWRKLRVGDTDQIWNEDFPFYFNDTDLSFRARKQGVPLTVVSVPEVTHFKKISAAQINIPKLYQEGRNVFLRKWGKNR